MAYVEFKDEEGKTNALALNNTHFMGQNLEVLQKEKRVPYWKLNEANGGEGSLKW